MMISLHMPKCGGTSFMKLLRSHYRLRFAKDYDYPIHKTEAERTEDAIRARKKIRLKQAYLYMYRFKKCIHGHFLPYKYSDFYGKNNTNFITWLRDPIERLVSHYNYWFYIYDKTPRPKPLHEKVVKEKWTLEKFAFSEELQNIYSKFLWKFPIQQFNFIGLTEHYEEDVHYFARTFLNTSAIKIPKTNVTSNKEKSTITDEGMIRELRSFHANDYEIYNYAVGARKSRKVPA